MKTSKSSNQITGNTGLFYVCYELSKRGWNVLPTSRNTVGIDIVIYNQDGSLKHTIQVKTLSKKAPIPLGKKPDYWIADLIMICLLDASIPKIYILSTNEIKEREDVKNQDHKGKAKGFWAVNNKRAWEEFSDKYLDNWDVLN